MGNIDLEVAHVLEEAADLYESEKIDWCTGTWLHTFSGALSMCAEGALMRAAGYQDQTIWEFAQYYNEALLEEAGVEEYLRYTGARALVNVAIATDIPSWNDEVLAQDRSTAKQTVIDTFRAVAKDVRNQAPAEEL